MRRFLLGLALGLCLATQSFYLEAIGHGTVAPTAFGASLLALMGDLGPIIPSFGMPLIWGLYFLLIPDIESKGKKYGVLMIVLSLHVITGVWFSIDDRGGMGRAYALQKGGLIGFFLLLLISISLLVLVTVKARRSVEADSLAKT